MPESTGTFTLRFDLESAYALSPGAESDDNWRVWVDEAVKAVTAIVKTLVACNAPATFFVVGKVLQKAGDRLADVLKSHPRAVAHVQPHVHQVWR